MATHSKCIEERFEWGQGTSVGDQPYYPAPYNDVDLCSAASALTDAQVYVPRQPKHKTLQDGMMYVAEYSDFDQYDNPKIITEYSCIPDILGNCPSPHTVERIRTLTYNTDPVKNVIHGVIDSETITTTPGTGAKAVNTYDYDGNLLLMTETHAGVGGAETFYHYGPDGTRLATSDSSGVITKNYVRGTGGLIATVDGVGGTLRYMYSDHQQSVLARGLSDGSIECQNLYEPFGYSVSPAGSCGELTYTEQQWDDAGGGLYYYGARWYDPKLGRFISPELVLGDVTNPQRINRYSYVGNNPFKYVDPFGLFWLYTSKLGGNKLWVLKGDTVVYKNHVATVVGQDANGGVLMVERTFGRNGRRPSEEKSSKGHAYWKTHLHPDWEDKENTEHLAAEDALGVIPVKKAHTSKEVRDANANPDLRVNWEQDLPNNCLGHVNAIRDTLKEETIDTDVLDAPPEVDKSREYDPDAPDPVPDESADSGEETTQDEEKYAHVVQGKRDGHEKNLR